MNGARVNSIVNELKGEKIDIINWNENPALLIENALSPAKVVVVLADPEEKTAKVVVPDYQLSLAIGKEGQNARLAARLTGFKIDIKSESQANAIEGFYEGFYDEDDDDEDAENYEEPELEDRDRFRRGVIALSTVRKVPMRQCIGCQEMKSKKEMMRILRTTENEIVLDTTGRKNGRGAYLCKNPGMPPESDKIQRPGEVF